MNKTALIVFQKNEILGKVKTRLAATLGNEEALKIYQILIAHTHHEIIPIEADKYIFYSDFIPGSLESNDSVLLHQVQTGNDLGERMKNAFELLFKKGYKKVLIIGTDCAALEAKHIQFAIQKLDLVDVVIGPAEDGGYYLLGMKKTIPNLFTEMEWSTEWVMTETISRLTQANLSYSTIETLSDIDQEEDWDKVKLNFNKNR